MICVCARTQKLVVVGFDVAACQAMTFFSLFKPDVLWMSPTLCLVRPVPGSLSSLLHLRNRQRQPLPASMPGTLPDPTMPGSSAVLMPVSVQQRRAHSTFTHISRMHGRSHSLVRGDSANSHNCAGLQFLDRARVQLKRLVTVYEGGIWCRKRMSGRMSWMTFWSRTSI